MPRPRLKAESNDREIIRAEYRRANAIYYNRNRMEVLEKAKAKRKWKREHPNGYVAYLKEREKLLE